MATEKEGSAVHSTAFQEEVMAVSNHPLRPDAGLDVVKDICSERGMKYVEEFGNLCKEVGLHTVGSMQRFAESLPSLIEMLPFDTATKLGRLQANAYYASIAVSILPETLAPETLRGP